MTQAEFVMWLSGYLNGKSNLSIEQIVVIETQIKAIKADAILTIGVPYTPPMPWPYVVTCNAGDNVLCEDGYALGVC